MHHKEWAENKEPIMAINIALNVAKRPSSSNGKNKSEVSLLEEATGVMYDCKTGHANVMYVLNLCGNCYILFS